MVGLPVCLVYRVYSNKIADSGNIIGKTEPGTRFIGRVPGYPGTRHGPNGCNNSAVTQKQRSGLGDAC